MGACASSSKNKHSKVKQGGLHNFFAYVDHTFQRINPFSKIEPASKQTGTIGDKVVITWQSDRQANVYETTKEQLHGKRFDDHSFPPTENSISTKHEELKVVSKIVWKRAEEFLGKNPSVFNKIDPTDIRQGKLGDCYLLSSMAVLAEHPECIQKLFVTKTFQENGLYCVWLCHDGEFVQILLDDYFPCYVNGGPVFSKSVGNELWVILLEKAFAKSYGTYQKIASGNAAKAMKDLTGAPYEQFSDKNKSADHYWNYILSNRQKNYILTASSHQDCQGIEIENKQGIISGHAYAILDAQEVVDSTGQKDRILRLRNPWGHKEWKGDWSDGSTRWSTQLREKFHLNKKDDGIFWINVEDFIQFYGLIQTAKIHPNYWYSGIKVKEVANTDPLSQHVVLMRLAEKSHVFISLTQKDQRNYKDTGIPYKSSFLKMLVGAIDSSSGQISRFIGGSMNNHRDLTIEVDLEAGDYAIYSEVQWLQQVTRHLVVNAYASSVISFSEEDVGIDLKTKILDGLLRYHATTQKQTTYAENISSTSGTIGGYVYYLYNNKSTDQVLNQKVHLNKHRHLSICAPFTQTDEFAIHLSPSQEILVKFRIENDNFNFEPEPVSTVSKFDYKDELRNQALTKPTSTETRDQDGTANISVSILKHEHGVAILYKSKSTKVYQERIRLDLVNLAIDGVGDPSDLLVEVPPKQEYFLLLKPIDVLAETSFKINVINQAAIQ